MKPAVSCAALLLIASLASPAEAGVKVEPLEGGARFKVTFRHQPVIAAKRVAVAGSFNGWSKEKTLLQDKDGDGTWTATMVLARGSYHYKFVLNGDVWQQDGDNPKSTPDGHSGRNSVLDLGRDQASAPGRAGDGSINMKELLHDPADLAYACAVDGRKRLVLRIHTLKDDLERVRVLATPRPRGGKGGVLARRIAVWKGRHVYEARLSWSRAPARVRYSFQLEDGEAKRRFPVKKRARFSVSMAKAGRFVTPDWVRDAVFYQIFPDRFRNGRSDNQPNLPRRPAGKPWHIDDRFLEDWDAKPSHFNFMGGDLAGITEKADYLKSLGVTALYLNPIFKAASNHRYDASDYETIDPALGTLDEFHALRDACKQRKMRILLDCVFNHTGDSHYAFQDAKKKGPKSKFWSWYFFDGGFPVKQSPKPNYRAWWGFGSLPQLNTKNPEVVKHLMGVGKQWLKEGASGWRLDVPNELDAVNPQFWPDFRKMVKRYDPESYIVGEIWTDARSWLRGDKFDAVMNYPVRSAALEFLVQSKIDARQFRDQLSGQLATYPEPALRVQFNLLGSHDTARIKTLASGDMRRVRQAMTFLFAWLGPPVVYYGDEVGVDGGKDPACRKTFPWKKDRQDATTLGHVRKLGKLRQQERTLRRGTVRFLAADGRTSAFVREPEQGERGRPVVCVLNGDGIEQTVRIPASGLEGTPVELLSGRRVRWADGALELTLPAHGSALIALVK